MTNRASDPELMSEELAAILDAFDALSTWDLDGMVAEMKSSRHAVEMLADEVSRLTTAIEGLVMELRSPSGSYGQRTSPERLVVTSMPRDPLATDWQLNRLRPEDLPDEITGYSPAAQQDLFE